MSTSQSQSLAAALTWLKSFDRFHIRPGLERMEAMLAALGHPERGLRFLHIAGTNGKGSTGAFTAQLLRAHGQTVGVFSSPAIMHELDRIKYNGDRITDGDFLQCVATLQTVAAQLDERPTEFEVMTTLALVYFSTVRPDWVVWETGLGGRWDSTNVVDPVLSIITNVGHDHMAILGDTIEQIAAEKAGIVKQGRPVVTAAAPPATGVIRAQAEKMEAPFYALSDYVHTGGSSGKGRGAHDRSEARACSDAHGEAHARVGDRLDRQDHQDHPNGRTHRAHDRNERSGRRQQRFTYRGLVHEWEQLAIPLLGDHQVQNAALSLFALELLEREGYVHLSDLAVTCGLAATEWPGRMELVQEQPLLLLDAAHNREAAVQLKQALETYFTYDKCWLIIGIFADKDIAAVTEPLGQLADDMVATSGDNPRYVAASTLAAQLKEAFPAKRVRTVAAPEAAVQLAMRHCKTNDLIVVAGSHDLMSRVRKHLVQTKVKVGG
ncbi:bifunctional folylpolyglutamate synthase/dihydrofolate synthase [Numidum massiliense]|uniref:bifunctional folylpolyglutamate synthase/dihydrofolate synthase n=1 Tax=Numidum massiliense TaxID=1522315 RepID=UPI0006D598C3|nr:folylpolyglutamate synthase/dihydrofolate synthase family protein [Numidum massiliense]